MNFLKSTKKIKYSNIVQPDDAALDFQEIDIPLDDLGASLTSSTSSSSSPRLPTCFEIDSEYCEQLVDISEPYLKNLLGEQDGVTRLESLFRTSVHHGITATEADISDRKNHFGENILPEAKQRSILSYFWESFQDHTLILLSVSALVSLLIGVLWSGGDKGWIESISIIMAVVIVVTVTSLNNYSKERQFRRLNERRDGARVKCIRGGVQMLIDVKELLVGDVVVVETGVIVPTDGVLVEGFNVAAEQSSTTGESGAVSKDAKGDCLLLSGSRIIEGYGRMLVVAIGTHSFTGKTMMALRTPDEKTPLEEKLDELADRIGKIGLSIAVATFFILTAKLIVIYLTSGKHFGRDFVNDIVAYFITSVTIVVVVVPEGLPLAVTIALAYSMLKMLADNNLVRKLEACETMGGCTTICSDKTGTLTENKMSVVACIASGTKLCETIGQTSQADYTRMIDELGQDGVHLLTQAVAINSTAFLSDNQFVGNQTECALLDFVRSIGGDMMNHRGRNVVVMMTPFSSTAKSMSTVISNPDGTFRYHIKGASETIIDRCTHWVGTKCTVHPLKDDKKAKFLARVKEMATDSLRTICLAYTDVPIERDWETYEPTMLTLIGVFGIRDPIRKEVPEAVRISQRAGITVRMITGDNIDTAMNIARKVGILDKDGICMEGSQFRNLDPIEMEILVPKIKVIARSTPLDKQLFVAKLKEMGEIVAVTGDGTNDAPSLRLANVGFSMGISGTEISKEASDIILLDDNFASIVNSIKWGRNVMESIQKFLQFQLTVNIVAVVVSFIGSVSNQKGYSPLTAVQLLWINLIMDTFASLALATEAPRDELLLKKSGIFKNWQFTTIVLFSVAVQVILVEYGGDFIKTEKLTPFEWMCTVGVGAIGIPIGTILKSVRVFYSVRHKSSKKKELQQSKSAVSKKRWHRIINSTRTQLRIIKKMKRLALQKSIANNTIAIDIIVPSDHLSIPNTDKMDLQVDDDDNSSNYDSPLLEVGSRIN
eukprot:gene13858-16342_t